MQLHIHIHDHRKDDKVVEMLTHIHNHIKTIEMTQAELAQALADVSAQVDKTKTEITTKIANLEAAIGNAGTTSPEVDAALAALKTAVQGVDDIVPDAPAGPTE